jgi:microcystin-dependent protein
MTQPYVGEIRMGGWNFAPAGWMMCQGQLLPISEFETLFNLIGTTYGGDGQTTFALPDLRSRVPMHQGSGFPLAQLAGAETVTINGSQVPTHGHPFNASLNAGSQASPTGNVPATYNVAGGAAYFQITPTGATPAQTIGSTGGSQPHDNRQPYLGITFIISLFGVFPSPS